MKTKKDYNHLYKFIDELTEEEKNNLENQINEIPFDLLNKIYLDSYKDIELNKNLVSPLDYYEKDKIDKEFYKNIGEKYINNYALITMAGGSGSRLGYNGPKGTYEFKIKEKTTSMFNIYAEKLKKLFKKYNVYIPWYIMTSINNNDETIKYFEKHNYFDYPKNKIKFFKQKEIPILDIKGNCLLKDKYNILKASNGNGEIFNALYTNGIIDDLIKNNIMYIEVLNIDNILARVFDPIFIGLMNYTNNLVGTKTLFKKDNNTPEYVFFKYNNKPYLYNLNEIDKNLELEQKNDNFLYRNTFFGVSIFHINALIELKDKELPYNRAYKNYNHYDINGNYIDTKEKNTFKFEKFIFDAFNYFDDLLLYKVDKETEFAPIKNKEGLDSIETAVKAYEEVENKN